MTVHCTENLHSYGARTRAVDTGVCPAYHMAITAIIITVAIALIVININIIIKIIIKMIIITIIINKKIL